MGFFVIKSMYCNSNAFVAPYLNLYAVITPRNREVPLFHALSWNLKIPKFKYDVFLIFLLITFYQKKMAEMHSIPTVVSTIFIVLKQPLASVRLWPFADRQLIKNITNLNDRYEDFFETASLLCWPVKTKCRLHSSLIKV